MISLGWRKLCLVGDEADCSYFSPWGGVADQMVMMKQFCGYI